ncbi:related to USO1-intracellular protein transport protein [Phialocephala subalpina]|uniref:Related to USO1-intracellular protein transport protein n=1 Tax=Phialocephala subalpina TaxID=576137 RepID=A0A1L7WK30_9HELO|nr:related to USO1-intracellular protein transport protein [Phialocephala subalpina]
MADAEEKAKAEKLAAAKKRVEEMKKKKQKKASTKKEEKAEPAESSKAEEPSETAAEPTPDDVKEEEPKEAEEPEIDEKTPLVSPASHGRQPSLSLESKMRSASFRAGSGGPLSPSYGFSPDGDTAPDIYRKQASRIEELEKENKRLAREASDGERRWKKAEEELEEMREAEDEVAPKRDISTSPGSPEEVEKLRTDIAALQRQNTQLLAQSSRPRHGSSPSMSAGAPADYEAALASKSNTIESMEIEISTLRGRLDQIAAGSSEKEQVTALEEKLTRSEKAAAVAQRELGDLKKNLERTTQKAVKEGSDRISAETKLRTLEREAEEAKSHSSELQKKVDALEKKVTTLATLHKEHDARFQAQKKEREKAEKDASELRTKLISLETDNSRLKEAQEIARKHAALGADDSGVDELENEERQRLEKKVRDLESEVHELRRGVWRDRRQQLEGDDIGLRGLRR